MTCHGNTDGWDTYLGMKFCYEKLLKEKRRAKHSEEERLRTCMLSELQSSAKYPEVKMAAKDREGRRATNRTGVL